MKPDTCLHSEFKAVRLTTWYSCLFGWKVRPHQNLYLHKTFDLPQMNAQDKVSTTLLRLEEFIFHVSPNYLRCCQLCGKAAQKVGGKGKRLEPCYNVENDKEISGEEIWDFIFSQVACLVHWFLTDSTTVDWNMLSLHLLPAFLEYLVCRRGTALLLSLWSLGGRLLWQLEICCDEEGLWS